MYFFKPFHSQDLISISPYCLSHSSYEVSSENLVLTNNHLLDIFFNSHY